MTKKDLNEKINRQKNLHKLIWFKIQIRECENYIEVGTLNWLREMCLRAIEHLTLTAKKIAKRYNFEFKQ